MSQEMEKAMRGMRAFMFEAVYRNPAAKEEEEKAKRLLVKLYDYYSSHLEALPEEYRMLINRGEREERVVCDYIAGMTDQYAMKKFSELYIPRAWQV